MKETKPEALDLKEQKHSLTTTPILGIVLSFSLVWCEIIIIIN